jgi:NADH-quinone oxidoreductase subunit K
MFAIFAISIAAAESAVGLALVIAIYRHYRSVDVDEMKSLKG